MPLVRCSNMEKASMNLPEHLLLGSSRVFHVKPNKASSEKRKHDIDNTFLVPEATVD